MTTITITIRSKIGWNYSRPIVSAPQTPDYAPMPDRPLYTGTYRQVEMDIAHNFDYLRSVLTCKATYFAKYKGQWKRIKTKGIGSITHNPYCVDVTTTATHTPTGKTWTRESTYFTDKPAGNPKTNAQIAAADAEYCCYKIYLWLRKHAEERSYNHWINWIKTND